MLVLLLVTVPFGRPAASEPATEASSPVRVPVRAEAPAATAEPPSNPQAGAPVRPRGLLYRLAREGREGWLFGSLHVGRAVWFPMTSTVENALRAADPYVFEIAPDDLFDLGARFQQRFGRRPTDPALPEPLRDRLSNAYARLSGDRSDLDLLGPLALALRLAFLQAASLGYSPRTSPDAYVTALARRHGKTVLGLESVDEQLDAMIPLAASGEALLTRALDRFVDGSESRDIEAQIEAWKDGRTAALQSILDRVFVAQSGSEPAAAPTLRSATGGVDGLSAAVQDALLCQRNRRWIQRIDATAAPAKRPLFVVGALHLVGECSLPALLAREGWAVTEVLPASPAAR